MTQKFYNGIAILDRPISIDDKQIYGVLFNAQCENTNTENWDDLSDYIAYLVGTEQFLKNGGDISDNGTLWMLPDRMHSFNYKSLRHIVPLLMKGLVGHQRLKVSAGIEYQDGEVDAEDSELVINPTLIERYIGSTNPTSTTDPNSTNDADTKIIISK